MSTETRAQNVAAVLDDFQVEFGNTLGMWRGRLALAADPELIADKHVERAIWFHHEFRVEAGTEGTPDYIAVTLRFQTAVINGSFILNGPSDALAAIASWAAKTQPQYDQVCLRDEELQFWVRLSDETDARKAQARTPKPEPIICLFPPFPGDD